MTGRTSNLAPTHPAKRGNAMSVNPNEIQLPKKSMLARMWDILAEQDKNGRWELKWSTFQGFAIIVGIVLVTIYSYYSPPSRGHVWAVCVLAGGVALAMGVLVGFIFGVPRAAQDGNAPTLVAVVTYKANTNLEQISDWLTKIIVGVGLVQLTTIPGKLRNLADYFATAFGAPVVPGSVVLAILGYFGIFGFLLGYLWARIYLMKEFSES